MHLQVGWEEFILRRRDRDSLESSSRMNRYNYK